MTESREEKGADRRAAVISDTGGRADRGQPDLRVPSSGTDPRTVRTTPRPSHRKRQPSSPLAATPPSVRLTAFDFLNGRSLRAKSGIEDGDLPVLQPALQHRVWERFQPGEGPGRLAAVIGELSAEDGRFSVDGCSWTNDVSWVRGYQNVLAPMQRASTLFSEHLLAPGVPTSDPVTETRSSACWPAKPAATATGARAPGPTTGPSSLAAPARPPAHQPDPTLLKCR